MSKTHTIKTYKWGETVQSNESFMPTNLRSAYHFDPEQLVRELNLDIYEQEGLTDDQRRKNSRFMNAFFSHLDTQF